jgi:hypothetical protein
VGSEVRRARRRKITQLLLKLLDPAAARSDASQSCLSPLPIIVEPRRRVVNAAVKRGVEQRCVIHDSILRARHANLGARSPPPGSARTVA